MRVKDRYGFEGTTEEAIREILAPMSDGQVERLIERVEKLESLVSRFVSGRINTVDELNALAGFEQFEEVA